jgi:Chaperone of endosialidase
MENGVTQVAVGNGIWTRASITAVGNVTAANYYYNSDRSLKTNIVLISSPLEKIMRLNGYTFDWKSTGKPGLGVIAQEVEKVFPELVAESKSAS